MSILPEKQYINEEEPDCPICDAPMKFRFPKPDQFWDPFWGCSNFPECSGSRRIMPNGDAEEDNAWSTRIIDWKKLPEIPY